MSFRQIDEASQREVVAVVRSHVSAEFVATTLAAHGIRAAHVECFGYPSVDFAQGIRVTVASEEAAGAMEVLRALGGEEPPELT